MAGPQLAPRPTFDCLWCGRSWTTRSADDLEGWAKLCPDCLGKAGVNAFLIRGEIVELAAGTGWWSPLLASKGELWLYDAADAPLERARERLLAHGLRAHIHLRDAWAEPDRSVDAVVLGFWLSHVDRD